MRHKILYSAISFSLIFMAFSCSKPPRPATPVTHWRTAPHQWRGNRVMLMPVDSRIAILGKCSRQKQERVWAGAIRTGDMIASLLPNYLKSRQYDPVHFMTWSGKGMDAENQVVSFLSPRNTARMVYSLSYFAARIDNKPLNHLISPEDFRSLAVHADATLYTASWSVVNFHKKKNSIGKTLLYTGAIILGVAIVAVSILAIVGGKDGADILVKGMEAGGRVLVYAGKGFFQFFTKVPVRAVLQSVSKVAVHTARISARVATRVVLEGGVQIEMPLEQVEPVMQEESPVPAEAIAKEDPEQQQVNLMSNNYLGIIQGVSSLQPADLTPGYHMALVLVDNRSGRVVWDAHLFIPQHAKEQDFRSLLRDLFRSMPASGL
ncbi:hypothetical protein KKD52_08775 [Myxococcota bacterium]|nr:hypothetical protein [Myxococcota bacterium]MBU1410562.1 hypothetical protein [Myxococcota bacterium]MBU1510440.1 hypothetical protein [Myxococcota bacterium]